jgi:hypothetical protein
MRAKLLLESLKGRNHSEDLGVYGSISRLDGAMVSVLVIGPKVRAFEPCRGDGFLKALKIRCTPSFGGDVKLEAPCRNILWHINEMYEVRKRYFVDKIRNFLRPYPPDLLLDDWWQDCQRALVDESGIFSVSTSLHHGSQCSYYHLGMNNDGCSSET